jgi:small subunit ribosomal protein S20
MAKSTAKNTKKNGKSALKALKQSCKRKDINQSRKSEVKTSVKKVKDAILKGQNEVEVLALLSSASSLLHRASTKGVLKKNTASRKLSRLAISVKKHFALKNLSAK